MIEYVCHVKICFLVASLAVVLFYWLLSIQIFEYKLESHLDSLIVFVCFSLYSFPSDCNGDRDRIISCVTLCLAIVG